MKQVVAGALFAGAFAGLALVSPALVSPAVAGDAGRVAAVLDRCLAEGRGETCVGATVDGCVADLGGPSTVSYQRCIGTELEWWDAYLNTTYQAVMARARQIDAESPGYGTPNRPSDVDGLRGMQRAWITFRDATCDYEELQWWGGTGAHGARVECLARMTAAQALYLANFPR